MDSKLPSQLVESQELQATIAAVAQTRTEESEHHCKKASDHVKHLVAKCGGKEVQTKILYRVKPRSYFEKLKRVGENIVVPTLPFDESFNGHKGIPLVGAGLDVSWWGILLYPSPDGFGLPTRSPYGDTRLDVPIEKAINIHQHNLYYADFACAQGSDTHHHQIIVTRKGSKEDKVVRECGAALLDVHDNAFLVYIDGKFYHYNHKHFVIEIVFTFELEVPAVLTKIEDTRKVRVNEECSICRRPPTHVDVETALSAVPSDGVVPDEEEDERMDT